MCASAGLCRRMIQRMNPCRILVALAFLPIFASDAIAQPLLNPPPASAPAVPPGGAPEDGTARRTTPAETLPAPFDRPRFGPLGNPSAELRSLGRATQSIVEDSQDDWPALTRVIESFISAHEDVAGRSLRTPAGSLRPQVDLGLLYFWVGPDSVEEPTDDSRRAMDRARAILAAMDKREVVAQLLALSDSRGVVRPWKNDTMLMNQPLTDLGNVRQIARALWLSMKLHAETGAWDASLRDARAMCALSRLYLRQAGLRERELGAQLAVRTAEVIADIARADRPQNPPDDAALAGFDAALSSLPRVDMGPAFAGHAIIARDAVARCVAVDEKPPNPGRERAMAQINDLFVRAQRLAESTPRTRPDVALSMANWATTLPEEAVLVGIFGPELLRSMLTRDHAAAVIPGVRTMLAIERFRLRTGAYPRTIDEVLPPNADTPEAKTPRAALADPFNPQAAPMTYRLVDPASDPLARPYVLYSLGSDFKDNDATPHPMSNLAAIDPSAGSDVDLIINLPLRRTMPGAPTTVPPAPASTTPGKAPAP